jgi:threonine/homoserine/homoserine lactone efflux protein
METAAAFFAASLVLALAPGPDNIFVLTQSALFGRCAGLITTLGLATGLLFHTTAVTLGVAVLFKTYPVAFTAVKIIGALYLLYLAYLSFRRGASAAAIEKSSFTGYYALYRRGLVMNVTNPKVALFFLALLPQFADASRGYMAVQFITLGFIFMFATLIIFGAVAVLGGTLAGGFNKSVRGQIALNRAAGCIFIMLAALILL